MTATLTGARPAPSPPAPPRRPVRRTDAVLLGATVLTALVTLTAPPGPLRLCVTLAFLFCVPGAVLAGFLRLRGPALVAVVSVALGVSVTILLVVGMLTTGTWSPVAGFWSVLATTAVVVVARAVRHRSAPPPQVVVPAPRAAGPGPVHVSRLARSATVLAVVAAVSWAAGLRQVLPTDLGSFGLVTALSPLVLAAYPVLFAAVVVELVTRRRTWLLTATAVQGVVMVYGLQPLSQPVARFPTSWIHAGFANYISEHGDVLHNADGRFLWPGFFGAAAFVVRAAGSADVVPLLAWAPLVLAGLIVLGARALAVGVLGDGRAAWLATWVVLLGDWTEQDYFSPQGLTYVLLLAALALTLHTLCTPGLLEHRRHRWWELSVPDNRPVDRTLALAAVLLIAAAIVPTHQLTPVVLAGLLAVLRLGGRLWSTWLPVLVAVGVLAWLVLAAQEFWAGQLHMVIGTVGDASSVGAGLQARMTGIGGRFAILAARFAITAGVGALAVAGLLLLRRRGRPVLPLAALMVAPFGLALLQSYGGEILMRCFLFALPFLALGSGLALDALLGATRDRPSPRPRGAARRRRFAGAVAAGSVLAVLGLLLVTARGGNDAYSSFAPADVAAADHVYATARPGAVVREIAPFAPLLSQRRGDVAEAAVLVRCPPDELMACLRRDRADHLILSPPQDAYGRIFLGYPEGWMDRLEAELVARDGYRVAFDRDGRRVLSLPEGQR